MQRKKNYLIRRNENKIWLSKKQGWEYWMTLVLTCTEHEKAHELVKKLFDGKCSSPSIFRGRNNQENVLNIKKELLKVAC